MTDGFFALKFFGAGFAIYAIGEIADLEQFVVTGIWIMLAAIPVYGVIRSFSYYLLLHDADEEARQAVEQAHRDSDQH